jgi:hypothetical protein
MPVSYKEMCRLMSDPRMRRYLVAAAKNEELAVDLYWINIQLSGAMVKLIAVFEVILRNKIDIIGTELVGQGKGNWLSRFIDKDKFAVKTFTHSQLITDLPFGFWCSLFSGKNFMIIGSKLLSIFALNNRPTKPKPIRRKLHLIRLMRNRVAHHEPIIFSAEGMVSEIYANNVVVAVREMLILMSVAETVIEPFLKEIKTLLSRLKSKNPAV